MSKKKKVGAKVSLVLLSIFLFLFIFASAASAAVYGDINDDGNINVQDVVLVQRYVLGLGTLTDTQKSVADVNGDGNINVQDVTLIMQYSLGLIDEFPDAALQVVSVTAVNARQVEVVFNKLVDKAKAENESNYEVYLQGAMYSNVFRTSTYGADASVQSDGKTVWLTLDDEPAVRQFVNGSSLNRVIVKKAVGLSSDYTNSNVTYLDDTAPRFESVQSIGSSTIALTFSEPVNIVGSLVGKVTLTDSYGANVPLELEMLDVRTDDAKRQLIIDLDGGHLVYGRTYNVTVLSDSNIEDYGPGYSARAGIRQFVHSWQLSSLSVTASALDEFTVRLNFSNPVYLVGDLSDLEFRYNINHTSANKVIGTDIDGAGKDFPNSSVTASKQIDIKFDDPIYIGYGRVYIYSKDHNNSYITDSWGNILSNSTMVEFTVSETTAPRIEHARTVGNHHVVLSYNRSVETGGLLSLATAEQFEYLPNGVSGGHYADSIAISGNEVTLRFPSVGFASGNDYLNDDIRYVEDSIFTSYRIRDAITKEEAISPNVIERVYAGY